MHLPKLSTTTTYDAVTVKETSQAAMFTPTNIARVHTLQSIAAAHETILPNGVTIYRDAKARQLLSELVGQFPTLWLDQAFVDVPQHKWMKLPLQSDWETKVSGCAKVYPLGLRNKQVVDNTFDGLHTQGRPKWTTQSTPFSYPVFVVWKDLPGGERKGRAVVDIRGLNELIVPDAYPVPLQADVIATLQRCLHILVLTHHPFSTNGEFIQNTEICSLLSHIEVKKH